MGFTLRRIYPLVKPPVLSEKGVVWVRQLICWLLKSLLRPPVLETLALILAICRGNSSSYKKQIRTNLPISHVNKEVILVLNKTLYVVRFEINFTTGLAIRFAQSL
jgi:hypothetical protein